MWEKRDTSKPTTMNTHLFVFVCRTPTPAATPTKQRRDSFDKNECESLVKDHFHLDRVPVWLIVVCSCLYTVSAYSKEISTVLIQFRFRFQFRVQSGWSSARVRATVCSKCKALGNQNKSSFFYFEQLVE